MEDNHKEAFKNVINEVVAINKDLHSRLVEPGIEILMNAIPKSFLDSLSYFGVAFLRLAAERLILTGNSLHEDIQIDIIMEKDAYKNLSVKEVTLWSRVANVFSEVETAWKQFGISLEVFSPLGSPYPASHVSFHWKLY